jgi:actin-related protein 6
MGNERFMVPEALFHPADIGLNQAGIAEVVTQAVRAVARDLRAMMYTNVIVAGGCAGFPGFKTRFENELRPLVPMEDTLTIEVSDTPALDAWRGGSLVGAGEDFERLAVTREEWKKDASEFRRRYEEHAGVVKGRM